MASKTSAVADEPIDVLFALHENFDLMDFAGPLEVLTSAQHDVNDAGRSFSKLAITPSPA
jgi:transcriptional regulator GlxA family with amidase domain